MFAYVWMLSLSNVQVTIKTIHNSAANFRAGLFLIFFFF